MSEPPRQPGNAPPNDATADGPSSADDLDGGWGDEPEAAAASPGSAAPAAGDPPEAHLASIDDGWGDPDFPVDTSPPPPRAAEASVSASDTDAARETAVDANGKPPADDVVASTAPAAMEAVSSAVPAPASPVVEPTPSRPTAQPARRVHDLRARRVSRSTKDSPRFHEPVRTGARPTKSDAEAPAETEPRPGAEAQPAAEPERRAVPPIRRVRPVEVAPARKPGVPLGSVMPKTEPRDDGRRREVDTRPPSPEMRARRVDGDRPRNDRPGRGPRNARRDERPRRDARPRPSAETPSVEVTRAARPLEEQKKAPPASPPVAARVEPTPPPPPEPDANQDLLILSAAPVVLVQKSTKQKPQTAKEAMKARAAGKAQQKAAKKAKHARKEARGDEPASTDEAVTSDRDTAAQAPKKKRAQPATTTSRDEEPLPPPKRSLWQKVKGLFGAS